MVIGDAAARDALRDGLPLREWIITRCRGCKTKLVIPTRDLQSYLGADGAADHWPATLECPACNHRRRREESARERDLLRAVCRMERITAGMDRTDGAQAALLAAVPTLLHYYPEARQVFAAARRIGADWGLDAATLLRAAADAVEQGRDVADLIRTAAATGEGDC